MRKILDSLKSLALSDKQIEKLTGANVLLYEQINKYLTIEELLDHNDGKVILLYISRDDPNFGHWTSIFFSNHGGKKCVEFMDSYGGKPDDQLEYSTTAHGQNRKYLSKLLAEAPYKIVYNHNKFQKLKDNINTCGQHVAARINHNGLELKQFKKLLDEIILAAEKSEKIKLDYDDAVIILNYNKLKLL